MWPRVLQTPFILSMLAICMLSLAGCKSDVEDKTNEHNKSVINIDSVTIENSQTLREENSLSSVAIKKYYSIKACLSETSLGQKLDRRLVETTGTPLKSNMTDPAGCIFWDHTFDFDYTGSKTCITKTQEIHLPHSNFRKTLHYAVDLINDQVVDLQRGKGCTVITENLNTSLKSDGQSLIILDKINLFWTGEQEEKRSDVEFLEYRTKIESCIKSRVNNQPLTNTSMTINIESFEEGVENIKLENVRTDERGCFSKQYSSAYAQFHYSHWLQNYVDIKLTSGPLVNERIGTNIFVNPYEPSRAFFGIDERFDKPMENPIAKNNRIHVDGVMYIQIGNDIENFNVNDYLGLTVSKSYQVVLHPRLDQGHRFTKGQPRYTKMHDGRFRLQFMILAPDKDDIEITQDNFQNFTYITGAEKIVTVRDGVINSLISIPVKLADLPRLAKRTVSVFKLRPIDDIGLRETSVTGFFKAKIPWIKTNVIQDSVLQTDGDELQSRFNSTDHKDLVNDVRSQIDSKKDDILQELMRPDAKNSFSEGDEVLVEDIKRAEYKAYIEQLFNNINNYEQKEIFGNPKLFSNDHSRDIFLRHLTKIHDDITIETTVSNDTQEHKANEFKNFNIPEGLISGLYDLSKSGQLNKESEHFMALMKLVCRDAFAMPEQRGGLVGFFTDSDNPEYNHCKNNPEQYFSIDEIMHSKKINETRPLYSNGFNLSIGSRFSTTYSEGQTQYLSKRVGADVGIKLPFGEFFGAGLKIFDVSYTWSESEASTGASSDDVSTSKQLVVEKFVIEVEGEFEKCLLLQGKEYLPTAAMQTIGMSGAIILPRQLNQYNEKLEKNYYLCDQRKNEVIEEPWYYIQAFVPSMTLLRDSFGPTEIKLTKVLRGESSFNEFKKLFEDETKTYMAQKTNNSETPDHKLYQNWGHLLQNDPGPAVGNELIIRNFEGSFPGTIQ